MAEILCAANCGEQCCSAVPMNTKQVGRATITEEANFKCLEKSIERSRKRNLSEGLLRGDLARDRLKQQEETASPLLKKNRADCPTSPGSSPEPYYSPTGDSHETSPNMALTLAELKKFMDETTNKKLDNVDARLHQIEGSVSSNARRLDEQAVSIQANHASIMQIKADVDKLKTRESAITPPTWAAVTGAQPTTSKADDIEFRRARRSVRIWPVTGSNADALWNSTGLFLGTKLGMSGKLDKTKIEDISRVEIPSGPGVKDEALVRFVDSELRDMVMGAAAMLAPYVDGNGKPTAGLRIEVPHHLKQDFRLLFKFGQSLRTRHGKGTRRHVKFDDTSGGLYLNVKLPGDSTWSKVSTTVARRGLKVREQLSDEILERRLDIAGSAIDKPRAASVSGPSEATSMESESTSSAWTLRRPGSVSL